MNRQRVHVVLLLVLVAGRATGLCADDRQACAERLARLGAACQMFMAESQGQLPPRLSVLYYRAYVDDLEVFTCPGQAKPVTSREQIDADTGYVLDTGHEADKPRPLVRDRSPANHGGQGVHVFSDDGKVRWIPADGQPATGPGKTTPTATVVGPPLPPPATTAPTQGGVRVIASPVGGNVFLGVRTTPCAVDGALLGPIRRALKDMARGLDLADQILDPSALPLDTGHRIEEVQDGGVGAWWGLQMGDVLLTLGLVPLGRQGLSATVREYDTGDRVPLLLLRAGRLQTVEVDLLDLPTHIAEAPWYPAEGLDASGFAPPVSELSLYERVAPHGDLVSAGRALTAGAAFAACVIKHRGAPRASVVTVRWYQGTRACSEAVGIVEGDGTLVAVLIPGERNPLMPGAWHVGVWVGKAAAGRMDFEVR